MPKPKFLTPSSFDALMTAYQKDKPGHFGKTALAVVRRLALELVEFWEDEEEVYHGQACEWGKEHEPNAIYQYEKRQLCEVRPATFRIAQEHRYVGGTCDGLVGTDGGIEVKCPYNPVNHIRRADQLKAYQWQIHGYMWIYNLSWIDFVSYDPRHRLLGLELIIDRIDRDDAAILTLQKRCEAAYAEAQRLCAEWLNKFALPPTTL